jgi:hypothetical protein
MNRGGQVPESLVALGGGPAGLPYVMSSQRHEEAMASHLPEARQERYDLSRMANFPAYAAYRTEALGHTPEARRERYDLAGMEARAQMMGSQAQRDVGLAQARAQVAAAQVPHMPQVQAHEYNLQKLAQQEPSVESQRRAGLTGLGEAALGAGQPLPDVVAEGLTREFAPPRPGLGLGLSESSEERAFAGVVQGLSVDQRQKLQELATFGTPAELGKYLLSLDLPEAQREALLRMARGGQSTGQWGGGAMSLLRTLGPK